MICVKSIPSVLSQLEKFCVRENFKGWDPYDGLNSRLFNALPLRHLRSARLLWIQSFKRSRVNLRPLLGVPKEYNPKALALFILGYANLYRAGGKQEYIQKIEYLVDTLFPLESQGYQGICWGYNFDWQSRAFFIPKYTPNVIVTSFCGNALLTAQDILKKTAFIIKVRSICDFILKDLNRTTERGGGFCFSYSPLDSSRIFNASLWASQLLSRMYSLTAEPHLKDAAAQSVEFCVHNQNPDGSWYYGEAPNQRWIDSFHTAYNLQAIYDYQKYTHDMRFEDNFGKGLRYYLQNFFQKNGAPRYYLKCDYPYDVHSAATLISFLSRTEYFEESKSVVEGVLHWTIKNLWNRQGYFSYQRRPLGAVSIPYIRWSQAWMFYALSCYVRRVEGKISV